MSARALAPRRSGASDIIIPSAFGRQVARAAPASASLISKMSEIKAEYQAGRPSRFVREINGLSGGADAHIFNSYQLHRMREFSRAYDRDNPIIGQLVNRCRDNWGVDRFKLHPATGKPAIDRELAARFEAWAEDARACDAARGKTFWEMAALALRSAWIDGDIFALPLERGCVQLIESDRVDSPQRIGGDLFHGVRLDLQNAPLEYWFVNEPVAIRFGHWIPYAGAYGWDVRPAWDADGEPVVLHIFDPERATMTRGVTALHAIFQYLGMIDDTMFATLVKQQMSACAAMAITTAQDHNFGPRDTEAQSDGSTQVTEGMSPGLFMRLRPGEKLEGFSPNIPSSEFFEHMRFLLQLVGAQLGMPLELVLLDMTQGNFSAQRMAIQQARIGFERGQRWFSARFHRPIYRWKAQGWLEEMGLDWRAHPELLRHRWVPPGWPYFDPLVDAQADKMRLDAGFVSPRQLASEHGDDYEVIVDQTIEDNASMIQRAAAKAKEIDPKGELGITWRDVMGRSTPDGVTESKTSTDSTSTTDGPKPSASRQAPQRV